MSMDYNSMRNINVDCCCCYQAHNSTIKYYFYFRVKERRRFVGPNPGFESQLRLYERMGYAIDRSNIQFRMFRLQIAAEKVRKGWL